MNKQWNIRKVKEDIINKICDRFKISSIIAILLYNRGLDSLEKIEDFLSCNDGQYFSPFLLKDLDKAVDIILKSVLNEEKIVIFGDYDVDGITSVAILHDFFEKLLDYHNVMYILPNRDDGYGLNREYIDRMAQDDVKLLITVDCGICNIDEVTYAHEKRIKVIITDHHEIPEEIPMAEAIVNPKLDENSPHKYLAGVGVTFKLIQGYIEKNNLDKNFYNSIIDLVALGTIADIVPLLGENRLITKNGLEFMKKHKRPGIKALMQYVYGNNINSRTISFVIAPRINASGRIGDPYIALKLLISEDNSSAVKLAQELNEQNIKRQEIEKVILKNAENMVEKDERNSSVILLAHSDWNVGVIGIVSSKLKDKFYRPAFLISIDEETGIGKGSARSVEGFHLIEVLNELSDIIEDFGGHEFAAGFSIKKEKINEFHSRLVNIFDNNIEKEERIPVIDVDMQIKPKDISINMYDDIYKNLYPFGEKNPLPVFCIRDVKVKSANYFNDKHLSLWLTDGFYNMKAVYYNFVNNFPRGSVEKGDTLDVVFTLKLSFFKNESFIELQIIDFNFEKEVSEDFEYKVNNSEKLREKGNEFLFTGNYDRAIEYYNKALRLMSSDFKCFYNIGLAYNKKGDKSKAIYFFSKAQNLARDRDKDVYKKSSHKINKLKSGGV